MKNTYHVDGTVTYWSVFSQAWEVRANHVPVREMAAMNPHERKRIERHFSKRYFSKRSDDETSHYRCES